MLAVAAVFALGALVSPWIATGRFDPLLGLPVRLALAPLLALGLAGTVAARRASIGLAAVMLLGLDLLVEAVWATRLAPMQALLAASLVALGMAAAHWAMTRWPTWRVAILAGFAVAGLVTGGMLAYAAEQMRSSHSPVRVALVTSLPLSAASSAAPADLLAGRASDQPALTELRRRFPLTLAPAPTREALVGQDVLLAVHPAALPPATLAALDAWLRAGGKALILADAYSSWPPPFPLGDPRNPPITSLLTPLIAHWGLNLDLDHRDMDGARRLVIDGDDRLILTSAGHFTVKPGTATCAVRGGGAIADCAVGRGRAILLADADLLQEDQWRRQGGMRHSDNIDWIAAAIDTLAGRQRERRWWAPVWAKNQAF